MSGAWRAIPSAPEPGARICLEAEMTGPVHGCDLGGFPVLLVRSAGGLRAYVNACPHQHLPLDWRSSGILSPDGVSLRCSNHDARFDAATGEGTGGYGAGCALIQVPIEIRGGEVIVGGV
ncbi:Rieske 2Fe-2S domain-containing protein [Roseicyclus sp. F158]|uniref:Rieske 2Fe-2S domain-containing protein n=1 Tax=Tropicimonas omnivorans TaxID=3075590 RepID=A0ABU3DL85_9RHOB|nr:Rieske 2Fe-2S domain-containing protein [Roseicyclus sp. F158]MDT0684466.1 Rieske 2Fe-2S domain-containing protein [Roseicyclus sp. F158]